MTDQQRRDTLQARGATGDLENLLTYLRSPYSGGSSNADPTPDGGEFWRGILQKGQEVGLFPVLTQVFPQLRFPIQDGMRAEADYRAATLSGSSDSRPGGLGLEHPEDLRLTIHDTGAGSVVALLPKGRHDFRSLVQAFLGKNQPIDVPASMGACAINGYNNWGRLHEMQNEFSLANPDGSWELRFAEIRATPHLFQDQMLLISDGPYSNVPASDLDLEPSTWPALSTEIRLYHESFHIMCKKRYGVMQINALDETLADYAGIVGATGSFQESWFLHFLGLESPEYRPGGRLQNYCEGLTPADFTILCGLVRDAAAQLSRLEPTFQGLTLEERLRRLLPYDLVQLAEGAPL